MRRRLFLYRMSVQLLNVNGPMSLATRSTVEAVLLSPAKTSVLGNGHVLVNRIQQNKESRIVLIRGSIERMFGENSAPALCWEKIARKGFKIQSTSRQQRRWLHFLRFLRLIASNIRRASQFDWTLGLWRRLWIAIRSEMFGRLADAKSAQKAY